MIFSLSGSFLEGFAFGGGSSIVFVNYSETWKACVLGIDAEKHPSAVPRNPYFETSPYKNGAVGTSWYTLVQKVNKCCFADIPLVRDSEEAVLYNVQYISKNF